MENISKWLIVKRLKLNENKIKLLEITMDNNIIFKINTVTIKKS